MLHKICKKTSITAWKVSKYEVISGPYVPVFGLNTGKDGPDITPYLHTFHAVYFCIFYVVKDTEVEAYSTEVSLC